MTLSGFTISFEHSKDYQRVNLIIYGAALVMLWCSGLAWYVQILLTVILIPIFIHNLNHNPQPFIKLCYSSNGWVLYDLKGQENSYKTAQIRFDGGFFILLVLQKDKDKKTLVIFRDQMSTQQYRTLRLMEKIEKKTEDIKV